MGAGSPPACEEGAALACEQTAEAGEPLQEEEDPKEAAASRNRIRDARAKSPATLSEEQKVQKWCNDRQQQIVHMVGILGGPDGFLTSSQQDSLVKTKVNPVLQFLIANPIEWKKLKKADVLGSSALWAVALAQNERATSAEGWVVREEAAQQVWSMERMHAFLEAHKGSQFSAEDHDVKANGKAKNRKLRIDSVGGGQELFLKLDALSTLLVRASHGGNGLAEPIKRGALPEVHKYAACKGTKAALLLKYNERMQDKSKVYVEKGVPAPGKSCVILEPTCDRRGKKRKQARADEEALEKKAKEQKKEAKEQKKEAKTVEREKRKKLKQQELWLYLLLIQLLVQSPD